jgi:hypothetical protein
MVVVTRRGEADWERCRLGVTLLGNLIVSFHRFEYVAGSLSGDELGALQYVLRYVGMATLNSGPPPDAPPHVRMYLLDLINDGFWDVASRYMPAYCRCCFGLFRNGHSRGAVGSIVRNFNSGSAYLVLMRMGFSIRQNDWVSFWHESMVWRVWLPVWAAEAGATVEAAHVAAAAQAAREEEGGMIQAAARVVAEAEAAAIDGVPERVLSAGAGVARRAVAVADAEGESSEDESYSCPDFDSDGNMILQEDRGSSAEGSESSLEFDEDGEMVVRDGMVRVLRRHHDEEDDDY